MSVEAKPGQASTTDVHVRVHSMHGHLIMVIRSSLCQARSKVDRVSAWRDHGLEVTSLAAAQPIGPSALSRTRTSFPFDAVPPTPPAASWLSCLGRRLLFLNDW